jgi:hypothetical protein
MLATRFCTIVCCLLLIDTIGCATAPRPVPPPGWPINWSDRQLFYTHGILVYARDGSAADTAADQVTHLENEFHRRTGGHATPGLIIVNDLADTRIGHLNLADLLGNAKEDVDSDAKRKKELAKIGIPFEEFALSLTLPIAKDQLATEPAFSASRLQTIEWSATIPTQSRVDQFGQHLIDGGLKAQNLNFFQRMLIMPFMPLIHGILNDALTAERDTVLYECLCNSQPGWSEEKKKTEIAAYQEQRMGEVVKSLKAATQQVSSGAEK